MVKNFSFYRFCFVPIQGCGYPRHFFLNVKQRTGCELVDIARGCFVENPMPVVDHPAKALRPVNNVTVFSDYSHGVAVVGETFNSQIFKIDIFGWAGVSFVNVLDKVFDGFFLIRWVAFGGSSLYKDHGFTLNNGAGSQTTRVSKENLTALALLDSSQGGINVKPFRLIAWVSFLLFQFLENGFQYCVGEFSHIPDRNLVDITGGRRDDNVTVQQKI